MKTIYITNFRLGRGERRKGEGGKTEKEGVQRVVKCGDRNGKEGIGNENSSTNTDINIRLQCIWRGRAMKTKVQGYVSLADFNWQELFPCHIGSSGQQSY